MRIRTIKPEFWSSESNGRLARDARLVFVGLINLADNEGRLQANPRFIASQVLPYDDDALAVVTAALVELERLGKIVTYEVEGSAYAAVTKFAEHQKTDDRYPSKLPPPPPPRQLPPTPAKRTRVAAKRTPVAAESTPLEQGSGTGNREVEVEQGSGAASAPATAPTVEDLREAWNSNTTSPLAKWVKGREQPARAALRRRPLEQWVEIFRRINSSRYLRGEEGNGNWIADIDWALRAEGRKTETATKVLEGAYDNRASVFSLRSKGPARPEDSAAAFAALPDDPDERAAAALEALAQ